MAAATVYENRSGISPSKEASQLDFMRRQLRVTPPAVTPADASAANLASKTIILTGGTSGLGFYSAVDLVQLGVGRLIITAHSEAKGREALKALKAKSKGSAQVIHVWPMDLEEYTNIVVFVERVKTLDRVDVDVQNAASFTTKYRVNPKTKHEHTAQVNYISNALLTILLLPVLQATKAPGSAQRIAWVNSETSAWAKFAERTASPIFAALDDEKNFDQIERYQTSKLLGQLFMVELARHVPASVAELTLINPGFCWGSTLHSEAKGISGGILAVFKRVIGRSSPMGSRTLTDIAIKHGEEVHGQYLGDCVLKPMAAVIYEPEGSELAKRLWKELMVELAPFNAEAIVAGVAKSFIQSSV